MTEGNKNKEKVRKSEAQSRGSDIQLVGIPEKEIMKEEEIIKKKKKKKNKKRKFLKTKECKSSDERSCTKTKYQGR